MTLLGMIVAALIPALISCSSSDPVSLDDKPTAPLLELPIGFCLDDYSRAADLSTVYDNFCVRSFKINADGSKSLVIPSYLVKYIDDQWVYSE